MGYFIGANGRTVDKREILKWFELAAEQRDPLALYYAANIYMEEMSGGIRKLESRATGCLEEAAILGNVKAQLILANFYSSRNGGTEDERTGVLYLALVYGLNKHELLA
mmetsp:Transcript_21260/g.40113  ORF Transcript_21260/g.40113 Transcript_21260/m.40113 type:complete len:109 (+) Transcript_21260:324-650(+)